MNPSARLRINPFASFHAIGDGAMLGRLSDTEVFAFTAAEYSLIFEFLVPARTDEVRERLHDDWSREDLDAAVGRFRAHGFLSEVTAVPDVVGEATSLLDLLAEPHRELFRGPSPLTEALRAGRPVFVRNALTPELAERVAGELDQHLHWQAVAQSQPFHGERHHVPTPGQVQPAEAQRVIDALLSVPSRALFSTLTGRDCTGMAHAAPVLRMAGSYQDPPAEAQVAGRSIGFHWFLNRPWSATWGGTFFWGGRDAVKPEHNTLVLFPLSATAWPMVGQVAPEARERLLTIEGYFCPAQLPLDEDPSAAAGWSQGGALVEVAPSIFFTPG